MNRAAPVSRGRRRQHVMAGALALSLIAAAAACGSDDDDGAAGPSTSANSTANSTAGSTGTGSVPGADRSEGCTGKPVRFATIFSLTGPLGIPGVGRAIEAAEHGINAECQLGRPIEIDVCDDHTDPNEAAVCGRKIAGEDDIAIIGHAGGFEEGVSTAGLPVFADAGGQPYMLTNQYAFTPSGSFTVLYGFANLVKAAGAKDILWVAQDLPPYQFIGSLVQSGAAPAGVNFDAIYYPPDTTDFATIAAQIASRKPSSVVFLTQQPIAFMRALDSEGIDPTNTVVVAGAPFTNDQIGDLGDLADGVYEAGVAWPYSDTGNEGIAQMHDELEAAKLDDSDIELIGVQAWGQVHAVADALSALSPDELDALPGKPQAFVDALIAASPLERAEIGPIDLRKPAWTPEQNPTLASLRSFSRAGLAIRIEDGKNVVVTDGFVDFSAPFTLSKT